MAGCDRTPMNGPDAPLIRFAPERRFRYWPYSAMLLAVWAWVLWLMGAPDALAPESTAQRFERSLVALAVTGVFPLFALWFLALPIRRAALEVRPDGLRIIPVGGRGEATIPWGDVVKIERRYRYRAPDELHFTLKSGDAGPLGRDGRLSESLFQGTLAALLEAIRKVAPLAGYALEGQRQDSGYKGEEVWRYRRREVWWMVPLGMRPEEEEAPAGAPLAVT
jgi:hypothetical protein